MPSTHARTHVSGMERVECVLIDSSGRPSCAWQLRRRRATRRGERRRDGERRGRRSAAALHTSGADATGHALFATCGRMAWWTAALGWPPLVALARRAAETRLRPLLGAVCAEDTGGSLQAFVDTRTDRWSTARRYVRYTYPQP